jgi:TonB-linked SusC/RagA family outer membrane protein
MKEKLVKQSVFLSKKLLYILFLQLFVWQIAIGKDAAPRQHSMVFAQQPSGQIITGTVTDESGSPLPGVSVVIKGTPVGTVTNSDGEYQIQKSENAQTLVFSFIGMQTKEIDIANQSVIDVILAEESTWLSEVVAVGYGIKQKKDLTGAVSVVDMEAISNIPVAGVDQMMQGRMAGVNIMGDYAPGGGVSVRVRGFSTVRNNDPLYIIDGVPVESGINMINPNDIESLQVLKDAASASIYGSRAANGVIIITTKKGVKEEATISFDTYAGVQSAANQLTPLSAQQYGDLLWEAHYNDGKTPANDIYGSGPSATIPQFLDADHKVPSTDLNWVDVIMQHALVQSHNLNISKGKDDSFYNLSLGYYDQEGIIKYTDFERVSVRFNSKSTFFDRLVIGENLSLAHSWSNRTTTNSVLGGVVYDAYKYPSIAPVYDVDGNFAGAFLNDIRNPLARLYHNKDNTSKQLKLFGNVFAELELIDGLLLKTNFGVDYGTNYQRSFNPKFQETGAHNPSTISTLSNSYSQMFEWVWTNTMNYSAQFNKHQIDVLAGMESIESTYEYFNASREGFPFEDENFRFLNAGDGGSQKNSGSGSRWSLISYFAKADYIYDQRYLASFTFRRDGSSKLGNNKWGNFPAFSLGWRVSEEDFFSTEIISNLKARFGWGQNGNQDVPPYATIESYYSNPYYSNYAIDGAQSSVNNGFTQTRNGNIDLKWETTSQTNFGLDLGFLNNRLNFTADYFIKNTKDLLLERPLPPIAGGTNQTVWDNVGEMQNKGFELLIDYQSKYGNNFSWKGSLNFSQIKNELTSLPDDIDFIALPSAYLHGVNFDQETSRSMVGHPISSFFGYRSLGIFQNQSEIDAHKVQPNAQPGDLKFEDVNKDGVLDGDDRDFIGNPHPDFTMGLNLGAQYKNFDVSLFFNGTVGNDVWDLTRYYGDFYNLSAYNKLDRTLDAWSTDNPNGTVPRLSLDDPNNNIRPSSYYISDASYLRLKTFTIGYTFNELARRLKASNIRVYVQALNLFTITGYEGLDPEVGLQSYSSEHRNLDIGVDRGLYPPSRTFMVGLNLNF